MAVGSCNLSVALTVKIWLHDGSQPCLPACFHGILNLVFSSLSHSSPGMLPLSIRAISHGRRRCLLAKSVSTIVRSSNDTQYIGLTKQTRGKVDTKIPKDAYLYQLLVNTAHASPYWGIERSRVTQHKPGALKQLKKGAAGAVQSLLYSPSCLG